MLRHSSLSADRYAPPNRRDWRVWPIGTKTSRNLVWRTVLYEYASQLPVTPVWASRVLSQICGPAAYLADRYLQRLSAIHWYTACCAGGIINVAVDRHGSAVTR